MICSQSVSGNKLSVSVWKLLYDMVYPQYISDGKPNLSSGLHNNI